MRHWPNSLPDYQWPGEFETFRVRARRRMLAAAFHLAYLIGLIVSLLDRRRDRILVIRTDGMGDGLLFEPALESLTQAMPNRQIHLWAPALTCELLKNCPSIGRMFPIPRGFKAGNLMYFASLEWRIKIGFALGRWTFEKAIYPVQSPEPLGNWLLLSARAEQRWINRGDTINQFDWQRSRIHERANLVLDNRIDNSHELDVNEQLARQWNYRDALRLPRVHLAEANHARILPQLDEWQDEMRKAGGRRLLGVVPAASMKINSYPQENWIIALQKLWEDDGLVPVLLGGPEDLDILDSLANQLNEINVPVLRMKETMGLLDLAALISRLDGIISVDTGLAHLAIAQHVPTVVLVGGGNPGRFFPWPQPRHHVALNVSMPCEGCNNRCMWREASCITLISPEQIVAAYESLKEPRVTVRIKPPPTRVYQQAS